MVSFHRIRRWFSLSLTVPLLGLAGCLPSVAEIRDLAVVNVQDFVTDIAAITIENGFTTLADG